MGMFLSGLLFLGMGILGSVPVMSQEQDPGNGVSADEIQDLFSQAKTKFRDGLDAVSKGQGQRGDVLLRESAALFQAILDRGGLENGYLYYNIGNCYFWLNDLGRAILNYRRAERTIPTDGDLRQNLHAARQKTIDRFTKTTESKLIETLFFWHFALPTRLTARATLGLFSALWVVALLNLFLRKKALRICVFILGFFLLVFAGSTAVHLYEANSVQGGVVVVDETTARKGDGESYEPAFEDPLHSGTEWELVEERGNWLEIRLLDGRQCWVEKAAISFV